MRLTTEQIAEVCHEANRALTKHVGDVPVQPHWKDAPADQRASSLSGVEFALANPNATPEDMHEQWMREKLKNGWTHGAVKDEAKKTHPMLVPFDQVPAGTKAKDALFRGIVAALEPLHETPLTKLMGQVPDAA